MAKCKTCGFQVFDGCDSGVIAADGGKYEGCPKMVTHLRQGHFLAFWPIPTRYHESDLESPPNKLQSAAMTKYCRILIGYGAKSISSRDGRLTGPCAVIQGENGNGKTFLAAGLANLLLESGYTVAFVDCVELLRDIKATFDHPSDEDEGWFLERLETVDFLVLDDLGKQAASQWNDETFWRLIKKRYDEERPTLITTNLSQEDRAKDDRWRGIEDRFRDDGLMLTVKGGSVRRPMDRARVLEIEA